PGGRLGKRPPLSSPRRCAEVAAPPHAIEPCLAPLRSSLTEITAIASPPPLHGRWCACRAFRVPFSCGCALSPRSGRGHERCAEFCDRGKPDAELPTHGGSDLAAWRCRQLVGRATAPTAPRRHLLPYRALHASRLPGFLAARSTKTIPSTGRLWDM